MSTLQTCIVFSTASLITLPPYLTPSENNSTKYHNNWNRLSWEGPILPKLIYETIELMHPLIRRNSAEMCRHDRRHVLG